MNTVDDMAAQATELQVHPLGESAWVLSLAHVRTDASCAAVHHLAQALKQAAWPALQEVVPGPTTLTVFADLDALMAQDDPDWGPRLQAWAVATLTGQRSSLAAKVSPPRRWRLPVCLDDDLAPDLADFARSCEVSPEVIRQALLTTVFRVDVLGFLPGFAYMHGWPQALAQPRRATPRVRVPAGSLAVAERMCAVYPFESPGGWHLLGAMPLPMFDPQHPMGPSWLAAGDEVQWMSVERSEYEALRQSAANAPGPWDREAYLAASGTAP